MKRLDQEHPEYTGLKEAYQQINTLYKGGVMMREAVIRSGQFLIKNAKELAEVYATRQLRFSYTNLLGNIVGWYISAMFKQPAQLVKRIDGAEGQEALNVPQDVQDFCEAFEKDCDRAGCSFNEFMRDVTESVLLFKRAYVVIDTPRPGDDAPPKTLKEQQDGGLLDPFLVLYRPIDVINWQADAYGNLEWCVIKIRTQDQTFLDDPAVTDYWYYFDRQQVARYERQIKSGTAVTSTDVGGQDETARMSDGYPRRHAMADQDRVPIECVEVPDGLWLGNRVFLPLVNHLNQDNALSFITHQSNLPQLVIEDGTNGSYEEPVTISAVGYHKIPNGGKMYYLEPAGQSIGESRQIIADIVESIYKACYLMDQARTNRSTPTAQSGVSKQADKTPSRDALSGIGDVIRPAQQNIYRDVLQIAGHDDIEPDIRGYDFSDKVTADDMALLEQATVVDVNSTTYERELAKKSVRLALPDANPETLDVIDDEIDKNPTPSEQQEQQQAQQQQAMVSKFQQSIKGAMQAGPQLQ